MKPNLKRHFLVLLILLYLGAGISCLLFISSSTSMEHNAVWGGYSFSRLVMIFLVILGSILGLAIQVFFLLDPSLAGIARIHRVSDRLKKGVPFLSFVFLLIGFLVFLTVIIRGGVQPSFSPYYVRGYPFIIWLAFVFFFFCGWMWINFVELHRSKEWKAIVQDGASFIRHLPLPFWIFLAVAVCAAGILIVFSPAFAGKMPRHDSGIFLYFGDRILKGDLPFRDIWDHKPPLIFYIDALGLLLADHSVWGVWWLELISLWVTLFLITLTLKERVKPSALFLALMGFLYGFVFSMEGGNLTEEFGLPLQAFCLWLFVRYILREKKRRSAWLWIGICLGLALMLKQTLVGLWLAIFLIYVCHLVQKRIRFDLAGLMFFAVGLALVIGLVILYFAGHQSLFEFWDVAYWYNFVYSDITWPDRLRALWAIVSIVFAQRCLVLLLASLAWIYIWIKDFKHFLQIDPVLQIILLNFPLEILLISLSGEDYDHYFFTILLSAAILLGFAWTALTHKMEAQKWARGLVFGGLLLAAGWNPAWQVHAAWTMKPDAAIQKVVDYVRQNSTERDYVLFWGDQTVLNYVTQRPAPTRFVHQKPLFRQGYASAGLSAELLRDLQTRQPAIIIDTHLDSTPFIRFDESQKCLLPETPLPEKMDKVFEYICDHYRMADDLGGKDKWLTYKKIETAQP